MEHKKDTTVKPHPASEQRKKRLGSALRENLKRRKAAPRADARSHTGEDAG